MSSIAAIDLRTYVVNLRRRPDRRGRMAKVVSDDLTVTFTSDWVGPFDGRDLDRPSLDAAGYRLFPWRIESDNPWWSRPLKYGEVGCTLAHLACWADAAARPEHYVLVLEDDVVLADAFVPRLLKSLSAIERARTFDLLYLGRFPLAPDTPAIPGVVVPGYSHCSFAYLLTRSAVARLLAARLDRAIVPVDEFLPAMYHDHPRPDIRQRFPPTLDALALDPPLVTQLPKDIAGSDTEDSPFVAV